MMLLMDITPPTFHDFFTWLSQGTAQVVMVKDVFGLWALTYIFPGIMVYKIATLAANAAIAHCHDLEIIATKLAQLMAYMAIILCLLKFWTLPFPGSSLTIPGMINEKADQLRGAVAASTLDQLATDVQGHSVNVGRPKEGNISGDFSYIGYRGIMILFEAVMFLVIMYSYLGFAVGVAVGPICIPMALLPATAGHFNRWLGGLIKFAMMRVVGQIVVYVVMGIVHALFNFIPWYVYILDLEDVMIVVIAVMVACLYAVFKIPALTSEYFGGGDSVSGFGTWISNSVSRAVSFASIAA